MKTHLILLIGCILCTTALAQPTRIPYRKGSKWGYVNPQMKPVIPFIYDDAYPFMEGLARVRQGTRYGFVNSNGKLVIQCVYDKASDYKELYDPLTETTSTEATVVKQGKRFAIRLDGQPIKARSYLVPEVGVDQQILTETDSLRVVDWPNERKALEHKTGQEVHIAPFNEVYIEIVADPVTGHYSTDKGQRYVVAGQTPEGWELYSGGGKRLSAELFDEVTLTPMMVIVQKNGRFGAINPLTGSVRVPIQYDSLYYRFCGEYCHAYLIKENGKWGTLDTGALTVPIEYDDLRLVPSIMDRALFITRKGDRYGFIGPAGVLAPRYESLEVATEDLLRVKLNGRYGYISLAGTPYFQD